MAYYALTTELKNKIWIMYLRKSRQDDPNETVEEVLAKHETILQEWARNNLGREIPEEYIYREIISGGESIDEREEMRKVLALMEDPNVAGVLCRDPQRLTRGSLEDCGKLISTLLYTKTIVATPMTTFDMREKRDLKFFESELMRGRDYLDYVKEVLYSGRIASVKRGCFIGNRPPYGYDKVKIGKDNTLVPNEKADIVRLIFHWYVNEDMSYQQIADKLNEMGVKTTFDAGWRKDSVASILRNHHYIGLVVYNRRQKIVTVESGEKRHRRFFMPEEEWTTAEGKHPAIVDREIFEKAQNKLNNNPRVGHDRPLNNQFAGILVCAKCGKTMTRHPYKKAADRMECPSTPICYKSAKEKDVAAVLLAALEDAELPTLKAKLSNGDGESAKIQQKIIDKLEKQMDEYRKQEEKQYDLLETGKYTQDLFDKRNAALRQKMEDCTEQINIAKQNLPKAINYQQKIKDLEEAIAALKDDTVSADRTNKLLKAIISRVEFSSTDGPERGQTQIHLKVFLRL